GRATFRWVNIRKPSERKPARSPLRLVKTIDDLDEEEMSDLASSLLDTASEARHDIVAFFEFVMKDFTGRVKQIKLYPHQKFGLEFIMAHDKCVCMWPIASSKCVDAETEIVDPWSGEVRTIEDVVEAPYQHTVHSWSKELGVHVAPLSAKCATGTKRCLRIGLRTGRHL